MLVYPIVDSGVTITSSIVDSGLRPRRAADDKHSVFIVEQNSVGIGAAVVLAVTLSSKPEAHNVS